MATSNTKICLTRYLYIYDEVKYSLLISLIFKEDFAEVLFWLSELVESGYIDEVWQFTFKIYFDFYAIKYPKLGIYIRKQYILYVRTTDVVHLIRCYKNMRIKHPDSTVFHTRILSNQIQNTIKHKPEQNIQLTMFRGRKPNIPIFEKHEIHCIQSILKNKMDNISYYYAILSEKEFISVIQRYLKHNKAKETYKNELYRNKSHIALCNMYSIHYAPKPENGIVVSVDTKDLDVYNSYNKVIEPVYKTLESNMKYEIKDEVSQFALERDSIKYSDLKDMYWYNWEVHCYKTPLWKKRFHAFNAKLVSKDNIDTIVFDNDNMNEEFWKKYNYEFDEQSLSTQNKTLKKIQFIEGNVPNIKGKIIY